ncbi:MAG TPA: lysylphosphatidylglycerol synthase transmembrane domain-containing protein [Bacteroidales bacterium]|nr:lysylphosphatidylglycerol synthase transmembrane domain-containing protein [Bacteroidales bacterium]
MMAGSRLTGALKFLLFLGIGVLITWLSLRGLSPGDRAHITASFREANYFWVLLVILIGVVSHVLRALRWLMLLRSSGDHPSLKNTFIAVMTGYFANLAFPRLGEVTRCGVLYTTDNIPVNRSFGTVITERAIDFITFLLMLAGVVALEYRLLIGYLDRRIFPGLLQKVQAPSEHIGALLVIFGVLLLLAGGVIFVMRSEPRHTFRFRIRTILLGFWQGLISIGKMRRPWLFVVYSLLIWVCYFLMTWITFRALPQTMHLSLLAGLSVLVMGTFGVMATPGGIGLYPVIAMETMSLYGIPATTGLAMGWIIWAAQTLMIILTGTAALLWLSMLKKRRKEGNL